MKRSSKVFTTIAGLFVCCLFMLPFSYWLYNDLQFKRHGIETVGTVVQLVEKKEGNNLTWSPVIIFRTKSDQVITVTFPISSAPPAFKVGEITPVYYMEENPNNNYIVGTIPFWLYIFMLVFCGVGFIGSIYTLLTFFYTKHKNRSQQRLKQQGLKIQAQYQSVRETRPYRTHPPIFCIICQWLHPETQTIHTFYSDKISYDPTQYIDRDTIDVYIESQNFEKYHMDISFLPELA